VHLQVTYGFADDTSYGAPPAGVDSGYGAFFWID